MAMKLGDMLKNLTSFLQTEPAVAALAAIVFILLILCVTLSIRVGRLTRGANGQSLEGTIKALGQRTSALESYARKNQDLTADMETRLARAIQSVVTERFDPFQQQGGQQSFTTAFVNEHGDGVIVSGIHSRDQVRVYAKPIKEFKSERELSEEETKAVAKAKQDIAKK